MRDFILNIKNSFSSNNMIRKFRKQSNPFTDQQFQFVYIKTAKSEINSFSKISISYAKQIPLGCTESMTREFYI